MPPTPEAEALPVEIDDEIFFDERACFRSCTGKCCRGKNYLMINIVDIYRIVSSPAAKLLNVRSTDDLFRRYPPLVQLFFNSEYGLYFPYIRYAPVGADPDVLPEDAPDSVCPFLFPVDRVFSLHHKKMPEWACDEADGCILMQDKPKVCRLSPIGKHTGLVAGMVSYVYAPPALDCPACETNVRVKLADYIEKAELPGEREQDERFHQVLMKAAGQAPDQEQRQRFYEIMRQVYNIDGLLLRHGIDLQHRPGIDLLVEICAIASRGNFDPYDELVEKLLHHTSGSEKRQDSEKQHR